MKDMIVNNDIINELNNNIDDLENFKSDGYITYDDSILKRRERVEKSGEQISKLIISYYYVFENENVLEVAKELHKHEEISALGVVDFENKIQGIIIRNDFFDLLGKPYARDIYKNRRISEVTEETKIFNEDLNIFTVADQLGEDLKIIDNKYYTLINKYESFAGIFSSKSILIYLSDITHKDLDLAQRLQNNIVRKEKIIKNKYIEIVCISKMAKGVGGDFYTCKKYIENKWILSICDVSGKGISASLLTSLLGGMFNSYDFKKGIKEFIRILNDYILETFKLEKYITGMLLEFNETSGEIRICDMGHSYLYILSKSRILKIKTDDSNYPIGITKKLNPVVNKYKLRNGDIIIIFTDGVIDQTNIEGEMYSVNRLENILKNNYQESLNKIKNELIKDINQFKKNQSQQDDITFILFKYL